jgi:hypothetical protein
MQTLATLASIIIVIVALGLSFAPDVTNRLNSARGWVRLISYLALTLAICPGAIWLFMLFGGPAQTQESRAEFTTFYMGAAFFPLIYRVLPALIALVAAALSPHTSAVKRLGKIAWLLFGLFMLYGVVLLVRDLASGQTEISENTWLLVIGCVLILLAWLVTHAVGWIAGFFVDPADRKIAIYTWGESETQMLGCFVTFLIGFGLGLLYGLVRFVKWAWVG